MYGVFAQTSYKSHHFIGILHDTKYSQGAVDQGKQVMTVLAIQDAAAAESGNESREQHASGIRDMRYKV